MEGFENWCDVIKFSLCEAPGSTVLNVLELLNVFVGDPDKKSITIVQPGGDSEVISRACQHVVRFKVVMKLGSNYLFQHF